MALPKQATSYTFTTELVDQADTRLFKSTPTLATGDWKVSKDQGSFANLNTLPTVGPAATRQVKIVLSATEMTADDVGVEGVDAAGAEWCDVGFHFSLGVRNADDLAYPVTTGRSLAVSSAGGVTMADDVAHGGPPGSSTATWAGKQMNLTNPAGAALNISKTGAGGISAAVNITNEVGGPGERGIYCSGEPAAYFVAWTNNGSVSIASTYGLLIDTGGNNDDAVRIIAAGSGKHDINLAGSGDILANLAGTTLDLTTAMTESYAADGAAMTPAQALHMIWSLLAERNVSSTTLTTKRLDGSTTAMTFTLNSATQPTGQTRST
jgi:hypothetical protein